MEFQLKDMVSLRGEKSQGYLKLGEEFTLPTTVICGQKTGKTVLVSAGVHGCEYPGIQTVQELAKAIVPREITGTIVFIHCVNQGGFEHRLEAVFSQDNKNLNRVFPGKKEGTFTERLAYFFQQEVFPFLDFHLDLHSGDKQESVIPFAYVAGACEEGVYKKALEACSVISGNYLAKSGSQGGLFNYSAVCGVPSVLLERGGQGLLVKEEVTAYKKDVVSVLKKLGVLQGQAKETKKTVFEKRVYTSSDIKGCWYPKVQPGDSFQKGEKLAEVKDFFGNTKKVYLGEEEGVMLYMHTAFSVREGDPLFCYGIKNESAQTNTILENIIKNSGIYA